MPEYAQIDLFVYKAKIFRNRFVTIGWFNQINYMRGRRQDRILFLIGSSPAGGLFLFLPAGLSNTRNHIESLTCIKGEDTHIADFPFWEKQYRYPYLFAPLSGPEGSGPYCMQVYPSAPRIRRKGKSMYSLENEGFAGRLKTLRKAKGMTQEKAAEELNISIEHLGNMERGQGKPSLELLAEIALYFHVSTDYLLLGRELDRDSVRVSLLELSAQMMELASKL